MRVSASTTCCFGAGFFAVFVFVCTPVVLQVSVPTCPNSLDFWALWVLASYTPCGRTSAIADHPCQKIAKAGLNKCTLEEVGCIAGWVQLLERVANMLFTCAPTSRIDRQDVRVLGGGVLGVPFAAITMYSRVLIFLGEALGVLLAEVRTRAAVALALLNLAALVVAALPFVALPFVALAARASNCAVTRTVWPRVVLIRLCIFVHDCEKHGTCIGCNSAEHDVIGRM